MAPVVCDGTEEQKKKLEFVKSNIISYPDFPKPGILFWWDIWFIIIIIIIIYVNEAVSRGGFVTVSTVNYLTKYCTIFRDLFPVLRNPSAFRALQDVMIDCVSQLTSRPEAVVALEARGFLFGTQIALHFDIPFIPIRKKGKLPGEVIHTSFALEYGTVSFSRDILFPPHSFHINTVFTYFHLTVHLFI